MNYGYMFMKLGKEKQVVCQSVPKHAAIQCDIEQDYMSQLI